jgi:putative SOS response-associated peptidase YedK
MCGRFALTSSPRDVEDYFALAGIEDFPPRYNIAPTQPVLLVMAGPRRAPGSNLPDRRAMLTRWGFVPGWAKNPKDVPLLINARSETAAEKATFRAAMRHRRALIPASGFYEWKREGKAVKQAYWIRPRNGGVIAFGALMETWHEPGGSEVDTSAILTTAASGAIAAIHDRMPVVIRPQDFSRWLDCVNHEPRDVVELMRPVEEGFFEAIPVSDKVNKFANIGPDIQERVEPAPQAASVQKPAAKKADAPPAQMKLF